MKYVCQPEEVWAPLSDPLCGTPLARIARQSEHYAQRQGLAEAEPVETCRALSFVLLWGARAFFPLLHQRDPDPLNVLRGRKKMCNEVVNSAVELLIGELEYWES